MTEPQSLEDLIASAHSSSWEVPVHVLRRVLLFVDDEAVEFADASIDRTDDGVSGELFVLTSLRAIFASFTDSYAMSESENTGRSTASAQVLPRNRLREVSLPGGVEGRNPDRWWQADFGDLWPHDAVIGLTYEGHDGLVLLPRGSNPPKTHRQRVRSMVPELLRDLA